MHQLFMRFKFFFALRHKAARDKQLKLSRRTRAILLRDCSEKSLVKGGE